MRVLIVFLVLGFAQAVCAQSPAPEAQSATVTEQAAPGPSQPAPADPDAELKAAAAAMAAAHARSYPEAERDEAPIQKSPYARYRAGKAVLGIAMGTVFALPFALAYDSADFFGVLVVPVLLVPALGSWGAVAVLGAKYGSPASYGSGFGGAALGAAVGFGLGAATLSGGSLEDSQAARILVMMGLTGVFSGLGATLTHSAAEDRAHARRQVKIGMIPTREGLTFAIGGRF